MSIEDLLLDLDKEIGEINDSEFDIEIIKTDYVPDEKDNNLTYENFEKKIKKVKLLETCVLFVDMRKSTELNLKHRPETLTKLYSSFIRSMIKATDFFDGKVRNIIGDRVMVVFDSVDCFLNAIYTAILMNTLQSLINYHFKDNTFSCGIGIDYGKMMVSKCGTIKKGKENSNYKSLIWLGEPANIASKLTDIAGKSSNKLRKELTVFNRYDNDDNISEQRITANRKMIKAIAAFIGTSQKKQKKGYRKPDIKNNLPPIIFTERFFKGLKSECTDLSIIYEIKKIERKIKAYKNNLFGMDSVFDCDLNGF
ncbi:MAG: adenylate/guanylate cyclase domain-containing protein [bacterium]